MRKFRTINIGQPTTSVEDFSQIPYLSSTARAIPHSWTSSPPLYGTIQPLPQVFSVQDLAHSTMGV
jgi:hypothetical protein